MEQPQPDMTPIHSWKQNNTIIYLAMLIMIENNQNRLSTKSYDKKDSKLFYQPNMLQVNRWDQVSKMVHLIPIFSNKKIAINLFS